MDLKKTLILFISILLNLFFVISLTAQTKGDVNSNGLIDTVDALVTAQYAVDLNPSPFDKTAADVHGCNGVIDILDALMIAQYTVELITEFPCTITPPSPTPSISVSPTPIPTNTNYNIGSHPIIYLNNANLLRLKSALSNKEPQAIRFKNMVDNQLNGADYYAFSASNAALMYKITDNTTYADYALNMCENYLTTAENTIAAGGRPEVARDSYLYAGSEIGDLMQVYDWCYHLLSQSQRNRWISFANQTVWNIWHPNQAQWGNVLYSWSGWSINNPYNNYYYSFLRATLTTGLATFHDNPEAATWLNIFRNDKIGNQLLPAFNTNLEGGGSLEGTGYGVSMNQLFKLFEMWNIAVGEDISSYTMHPKQSLINFIHLTVPTLDRIAPVGDHARESTAVLFDYHRSYQLVLTSFYKNENHGRIGQYYLNHCSVNPMQNAFNYIDDYLYDDPTIQELPLTSLYPVYYALGTGQIYMRSGWDNQATWAHFIAGPYMESHAHKDQGSFLFYKNEWFAYDQNINSHSGIQQGENVHNLVRLVQNGTDLHMMAGAAPAELISLQNNNYYTYCCADIKPIYNSIKIINNTREFLYLKPNTLIIFDRLQTNTEIEKIWQMNTPINPVINNNLAVLNGSKNNMTLIPILPQNPVMEKLNWSDIDPDMTGGGYKIQIKENSADGKSLFFNLLYFDNQVTAWTRQDETNMKGITLTLADNYSVTVKFYENQTGGSIIIRDNLKNIIINNELIKGIQNLPIYIE